MCFLHQRKGLQERHYCIVAVRSTWAYMVALLPICYIVTTIHLLRGGDRYMLCYWLRRVKHGRGPFLWRRFFIPRRSFCGIPGSCGRGPIYPLRVSPSIIIYEYFSVWYYIKEMINPSFISRIRQCNNLIQAVLLYFFQVQWDCVVNGDDARFKRREIRGTP